MRSRWKSDLGFLDMVLRLAKARSRNRKKAGQHVFEALSAYLDPYSRNANSRCVRYADQRQGTSWKRNNIHEALKAEALKSEDVHG